MKKILALTSICMLIVLFGCTIPSGETVTVSYPVENNYYRLYISDGIQVTVTDEVDEIVVTGDESVIAKLSVESTSSTLKIYRRDVSLVYLTPTEVLLPYNELLREVEASMDSEFYTPYGLESENVKITLNSRSRFDGYINANTLNLHMDDSKADLEGYAPNLILKLNDGAELEQHWAGNYFSFECDVCTGTMNSSTAYFHCYDEISVDMYNGSLIYYTSDYENIVDFSGVDGTSDVVYCGGTKK